jgi:hypothetical protein
LTSLSRSSIATQSSSSSGSACRTDSPSTLPSSECQSSEHPYSSLRNSTDGMDDALNFSSLQCHWRVAEGKASAGVPKPGSVQLASRTMDLCDNSLDGLKKSRVVSLSSVSERSEETDSSTLSVQEKIEEVLPSSPELSFDEQTVCQEAQHPNIDCLPSLVQDDAVSTYSEAEAIELPELDDSGHILTMVRDRVSRNNLCYSSAQRNVQAGYSASFPDNFKKEQDISGIDKIVAGFETVRNVGARGGDRFLSVDEFRVAHVAVSSDGEDDSGGEELARRDSFAASFARRATRKIDSRPSGRPRTLPMETHHDEVLQLGATSHVKPLSEGLFCRGAVLMERCAHALSELLDQNPKVSKRLTESTRTFASMFSSNEKQILGLVVRRALYIIRKDHQDQSRYFDGRRVTSLGQRLAAVRSRDASEQSSSDIQQDGFNRGDLVCSPQSARLARDILLGEQLTKHPKSGFVRDLRLIGNGKPGAALDAGANRPSRALGFKGHLAASFSNETIDLYLPFGSALIAILGAMARLDCSVSFRRFKNRHSVDRRDVVRTTVINVQACQDHTGRSFSFEIIALGGSPTRIVFRRPRFISLRRIDDYVDIVVDSKELLLEYCADVWRER